MAVQRRTEASGASEPSGSRPPGQRSASRESTDLPGPDLPGPDLPGPDLPGPDVPDHHLPGQQTDYLAAFEGLDSGLPLLLLPVRLETRFLPAQAPTELVVRIFPDDVQTDVHVSGLEPGEIGHGTAFWRNAWSAGTSRDTLDRLFARMASRLGPYRAAWVLAATRPLNWSQRPTTGPVLLVPAFPTPALREPVEPGRARLLPDRWVVAGYQRRERVFLVAGSPVTPDLPAVPDLAATDAAPHSLRELTDAQGLAWTHDLVAAESAGMAVRVPLGGWDVDEGVDLFVVGVCDGVADGRGVADLLAAQHWTRGLDLLRRGTPTNNSDDVPAGHSATAPDLVTLLDAVLEGGSPARGGARPDPAAARTAAPGPVDAGVPESGTGIPFGGLALADRTFSSALDRAQPDRGKRR